MSFVARLRAASAPDHDRVDALYGGFRLDEPEDYARFLLAHARALPAAEAALAAEPDLPAWRPRRDLLAADLATLGQAMPTPPVHDARGAAAWGLLYVTEGSRLGGAMLARRVPAHLPSAYLAARHGRGEWKRTLATIEARAAAADAAWAAAAMTGAREGFRLYERAAFT